VDRVTFSTQLEATYFPIGAVYDDASITQALSWAQSFVEEYCNRTEDGFDLITGDTVFIDPAPHRTALLPKIPVVNVDSVEGLLPSPTGMEFRTLTNFAFVKDTGLIYDTTGEPGVPFSFGPSWPTLPGGLQVTYDHGFETVPQGLINAACRFAQQYLENPALLLQRDVGSFNERYAGNTGGVGVVINVLDQKNHGPLLPGNYRMRFGQLVIQAVEHPDDVDRPALLEAADAFLSACPDDATRGPAMARTMAHRALDWRVWPTPENHHKLTRAVGAFKMNVDIQEMTN
jgi:hypothetical protein